jgi:hypothetical protein
MRPNNPGCYWWEDADGKPHVAEFTRWMDTSSPEGDDYELDVDEFEDCVCFKRWLGPACPPKDIDIEDMLDENGDLVMRFVDYDDVKEYLLERQCNEQK